ncbi:MAG: hypothetical protein ACR2IF_02020 [Terriglobales bacterium]
MVISGVVVETIMGRASAVAARLALVNGIRVAGSDGDHTLALVWRARCAEALQRASEQLLHSDADIVGIYPTFVGRE